MSLSIYNQLTCCRTVHLKKRRISKSRSDFVALINRIKKRDDKLITIWIIKCLYHHTSFLQPFNVTKSRSSLHWDRTWLTLALRSSYVERDGWSVTIPDGSIWKTSGCLRATSTTLACITPTCLPQTRNGLQCWRSPRGTERKFMKVNK